MTIESKNRGPVIWAAILSLCHTAPKLSRFGTGPIEVRESASPPRAIMCVHAQAGIRSKSSRTDDAKSDHVFLD